MAQSLFYQVDQLTLHLESDDLSRVSATELGRVSFVLGWLTRRRLSCSGSWRRFPFVFVEIVGDGALLDRLEVDRDEVEEVVEQAPGRDGEVSGAGSGLGRWNLDVEIGGDESATTVLIRVANALVGLGLGVVRIRPEGREALPATDLVG